MNNATLNNFVGHQMATPEVKQFDPDPAINKWVNSSIRTRRHCKEGSVKDLRSIHRQK